MSGTRYSPMAYFTLGPDVEFFSLAKPDIPRMIDYYVKIMEKGKTSDWCKCEWQIHPEDVSLKEGQCRDCRSPEKASIHILGPSGDNAIPQHRFSGRRMRRGNEHPECPVHTKEGLLLGFFEWAFPREARTNETVNLAYDRVIEPDDPSIETHVFKKDTTLIGSFCSVCGKWQLHHSHTGNRTACICRECS